jgi:hypothetical protein
MRLLSMPDIELVSGGADIICEYPLPGQFPNPNEFLIEQFFFFRMGQPSLFGTNPDAQLQDPLPTLPA